MRLSLAALAALVVASPAGAADLIRCTAKGQEPVTISLDAQRFKGRSMSCVSGSFIVDMTPCAPAGAFALSAPTGSASIVAVVPRWQDYASHDGGVIGFTQSPEALEFTGGFNSIDGGLTDNWSFRVDRISGIAKLTRHNQSDVSFSCARAKAKL